MENVSAQAQAEIHRYAREHGLPFDQAKDALRKEQLAEMMKKLDQRIAEVSAAPQQELPYEAEQRRIEVHVWNDRLAAAGIEERYFDATFAGWVPEDDARLKVAKSISDWFNFLDSPASPSIVFQGAKGTGKTHLAIGCLIDRLREGKDGLFTLAKAYTGAIRESYRRDSPEPESKILARYSNVGLLVIDDIGRQFDTEAEKLYLFDLINERYNKRKPTLFTTNMAVTHQDPKETPEFQKYVGEAIMDRLRQGGGKFVTFNWPSLRV